MKTILLTSALSLLACAAQAQNEPPPPAVQETAKNARAAAWLGIGMDVAGGQVVISNIAPDSPAAKAGLQNGDILMRIGDTAVDGNVERVVKSVTEKQPGDAIELHWKRGEKEGSTKIELAARPDPAEKDFRGEFRKPESPDAPERKVKKLKEEAKAALEKAADAAKDALEESRDNLEKLRQKKEELLERTIREEAPAFLGVAVEPGKDGNLLVTEVVPDSPAAKAGLREGDSLLSVGGEPLKGDAQRFVKMIGGKKPGEIVDLRWQRGDKEETSHIELAKRTLESDRKRAVEDFRNKIERSKEEFDRNARSFRLDSDPNAPDHDKSLHFFLDKGDGSGDKHWKLRLNDELPLFERKFPGGAEKLRDFSSKPAPREKQPNEDMIWRRVQKSVAGALDKSDIGPDVRETVMQAIENARRAGEDEHNRRAKIEAEAAQIEKEMQSLKDRANKLRDELKKSE